MTYTIFTLLFAGITALSTIAAFATCVIQYRSTRPQIKIKPDDQLIGGTKPQSLFCVHNDSAIALVTLDIQNSSQIAGTITDIYLKYGGKKYYCDSLYKQYDSEFDILSFDENKNPFIPDITHLKDPMIISPFFSFRGFLLFHNFAVINYLNEIIVDFHYKIIGKRQTHSYKIRLYRMVPKDTIDNTK